MVISVNAWMNHPAGTVAVLPAVAGLVVLHGDAHPLYRGLVAGAGLAAVIVSGAAGRAALALVVRRRFDVARYVAAVAAIVAAWALAQQPRLLPGLTVEQAAASHDTLIAVIVAVGGGGMVLVPALLLLFRLSLAGRPGYGDDDGGNAAEATGGRAPALKLHPARAAGLLATLCLLGGFGFLTVAEVDWAHAIGVPMLFAAIALGVAAAAPRLLEDGAG